MSMITSWPRSARRLPIQNQRIHIAGAAQGHDEEAKLVCWRIHACMAIRGRIVVPLFIHHSNHPQKGIANTA